MDIVVLEMVRNIIEIQPPGLKFYVFVKPDQDECLESVGRVEVVKLHANTYPFWEQVALPAACRKYGIDLLHCTSNTAPAWIEIPLLITLHDIIYLENRRAGGTLYQFFGNQYRRWITPRAVKHAEALITVSEFEKDRIQNYFEYQPEVHVVYNGISGLFFAEPFEAHKYLVKDSYGLPEKFIFFLGNTDPKKNTENVLRAVVKVLENTEKDLQFVIADYDEIKVRKLLKSLGRESLLHRFVFPGYIKNDDLPSIYRLAKVFLYPSLRESFGIPIIEAQACGTPVVTSNTSSMPEVSGGASLLVNPDNYEDIAEKTMQILTDENLSKKLSDDGLKNASRFSWKKTAESTIDIYNLILEKS